MAQTSYTPISLYYSATGGNTPLAANLVAGELAINTADGKLFYKDSSGVVQTIATKGGVNGTSNGQVLFNSSGAIGGSNNLFWDNSNGNLGIGTTSPGSYKLNVQGGRSFFAPNSEAFAIAIAYNSSTVGGYIGATATDTMVFSSSGGTERMRIDSSGNVGIGTSSPATYGKFAVISADNSVSTAIGYFSSNNLAQAVRIGYNGIYQATNNALVFGVNNAENMRIDSSGRLLVGTTSTLGFSEKLAVAGNIATTGLQMNMAPGQDFEFVQRSAYKMNFYVNNASVVASLSLTGVWTNASDARYKENIVDSKYGIDTVMALKPREYNLINQKDKPQVGFIAQEVLNVVPEVVDTAFNSITKEERYTLSYGQLTAVLTKAIQEQQAIINDLKSRIETLENK